MAKVPTATDGQVFDEYLGDIKLERLLALLENINRDYNSMSLILDQFRSVAGASNNGIGEQSHALPQYHPACGSAPGGSRS